MNRWLPQELCDITDKRLNSFYRIDDNEDSYQIFRLIDNNVMKMVSTVHNENEGDHVERLLKKPGVHKTVWDKDHTKNHFYCCNR